MDYTFFIEAKDEQVPLQKYLREALPEQPSLKTLRQLLEANSCTLNGKCERFGSTKLHRGDKITFRYPSIKKTSSPSSLYEDECLVVFNKEPGLSYDDSSFSSFFPVHRLDKGTSGAILFAKDKKSQEELINQFKDHKVEKLYLAITVSSPKKSEGILSTRYGKKRTLHGQAIWGIVENSSSPLATTMWWVLQSTLSHSLFAAKPVTGKTHQIRSHLSSLGCPLVGDVQYGWIPQGDIQATKPLLHAYLLRFFHPLTGKTIEIKAPLEQEFTQIAQKIFKQNPVSIDECLVRKNLLFG